MADKSPAWIQQEERIDHQLVRGIGISALTANIVSSTIGAGIFVIPAAVAKGLGSAAPLAFVCCAIAMVGSSDGRTYDGKQRWGVSVFDFKMPPPPKSGDAKISPAFVGYGRIPGLSGD